MKIAVVTAADDQYAPVSKITETVNIRYCQDHGYAFHSDWIIAPTWAETVWTKIHVLEDYLDRYDWLMWIDADAMVMNHSIRLESLIEAHERYDFIATYDENGFNAGVFLLRNCPWSHQYLSDVDALKPEFITHRYPEQAAMVAAVNAKWDNCNHGVCVPNKLLNQFWCAWQPGDFIVHHAGGSVEDKIKGLTPFLEQVRYA